MRRRAQGFTLLEVVVALTIFALLAVTVLARMGDSIRAEQRLRDKTEAVFIAQDTLTALRVEEDWSALRSQTDSREFGGRRWNIRITVSETGEESLRQVQVDVGPEADGRDAYLQSLTSLLGRY